MGAPNAPGLWRGVAQRVGRALVPRKQRGGLGREAALAQGHTVRRSVQAPQRLTRDQADQRQGLGRSRREGGAWRGHTRPRSQRLESRADHGRPSARWRLLALQEGSKPLRGPMAQGSAPGQGAAHTIGPVGRPPARAIGRTQAGKQTEWG
jgi:hypothetical protein